MPDSTPLPLTPRFQMDPSLPPKEALPTMYDLPDEDPEAPGLPDHFHDLQPSLLHETFKPPGYSDQDMFVCSDVNVYYDPHRPSRYKRPDWLAVLGQTVCYWDGELRYSYVLWQESLVPTVIVELLSRGTAREDLGRTHRDPKAPPTKWTVYERILGVPYYIVFGRKRTRPLVFERIAGSYQRIQWDTLPVWLPALGLGLGTWTGAYRGARARWLRWFDGDGHLIPTDWERAEAERARADAARLLAETERKRAETERKRAETEQKRAETAQKRVEAERKRAELAQRRIDTERERADTEHRLRLDAERRIAELEARLRAGGQPGDTT